MLVFYSWRIRFAACLLVLGTSAIQAQTLPHPTAVRASPTPVSSSSPDGAPTQMQAPTPSLVPAPKSGSLSPALPSGRDSHSAPTEPTATAVPAAALSGDARRIYESTRDKLVQIRTLLRNADTQASTGSGFFVSSDGLIVTNFHVASQLALDPERYRAVYVTVDGKGGEVELLAFDVQHDLAVLRAKDLASPVPVLSFRPAAQSLGQGERIYSLGNPLDIGFAVTEGTYNGLVRRSFYPRIFFGGTLNAGMSGGPAVDDAGQVLGVNVAKRLDGEQVSFLVPAEFAQALVQRAERAKPMTRPAYDEVTRQLLVHQSLLTDRLLKTPFQEQRHGRYRVPVPDDALARCWGTGRDPDLRGLNLERTQCQVDSDVVAGDFNTGMVRLRYEAYDAPSYGAARFARTYSKSFANEPLLQRGNRRVTGVECTESFVDGGHLPLRAVICMSAYRKLTGLYDMSVLVVTLNQPTQGVLGRMEVAGVGFDNGLKLADHYLTAFRWEAAP